MNKSIIIPSDFLDFMSTKNTIEIKDEEEFELFIIVLKQNGLLNETFELKEENSRTYEYWKKLVYINSKGKTDLLFEYDLYKGLTFYTDRQKSIDWYGKEPIHLKKIDKEKTCKYCGNEYDSYMFTTFETKNECFKVCPNCTTEHLDKIIKLIPKKQKCDCCNSNTSFEISTHFSSYHLCKKHMIDFFCYNLTKKSFKKLYKENSDGRCDFYLHDDFYLEDGMASQPNDEYAKELKDELKKEV